LKITLAVKLAVLVCILALVTACAAKRPVFYPNNHLDRVGKVQVEADVDQCMAEAKQYGVRDTSGEKVGGRAAKGAAIGAVVSAIVAAIFAGNVGRAAGAGAVGGAAGGAISGAVDAEDPDVAFRNYVDRCLTEKGYDVVGWQ